MITASTSCRSNTRRKSRPARSGFWLKSLSIRSAALVTCSSSTSHSATHFAPSRSAFRRSPVPWPPQPMSATRTLLLAPATRSCDPAVCADVDPDAASTPPAAPAATSLMNVRRVDGFMRPPMPRLYGRRRKSSAYSWASAPISLPKLHLHGGSDVRQRGDVARRAGTARAANKWGQHFGTLGSRYQRGFFAGVAFAFVSKETEFKNGLRLFDHDGRPGRGWRARGSRRSGRAREPICNHAGEKERHRILKVAMTK